MDPYRDVIPEDYSNEIRELVLERDGSDSESSPSKRARASTNTLLPQSSHEPNLEEPPKPEDNLSSYDHKRLQDGLQYITATRTRKITPRTREFLQLHKEAYRIALENAAPTTEALAVVQALDRVYSSAAFLLRPRKPEKQEELMIYVKLRHLELLANYGDYLGQELPEIRAELKAAAASGEPDAVNAAFQLGPPLTWLEISNQIKGTDVRQLEKDVSIACAILGIDSRHMRKLIHEWAERNETFHNQIRQHIIDCRWYQLADQLCRDIKELLPVSPDRETATRYEKVLLSIRDEYFDVVDPDDAEGWYANDKAKQLGKERQARMLKKAGKQ